MANVTLSLEDFMKLVDHVMAHWDDMESSEQKEIIQLIMKCKFKTEAPAALKRRIKETEQEGPPFSRSWTPR